MGYIGFRLGMYAELVKLFGLMFGFFVSFRYYQAPGDFLADKTFLSVEWAGALVMSLLVVSSYLLLTKGLRVLERLVQVTFQAKVSKVGGLLAGLFRAGLVSSVILVVCRQLPSASLSASIDQNSLTGSVISRLAPGIYDSTVPIFGRFLSSLRVPSS